MSDVEEESDEVLVDVVCSGKVLVHGLVRCSTCTRETKERRRGISKVVEDVVVQEVVCDDASLEE